MMRVTFTPARNGGVMTRDLSKVAFPIRGWSPPIGVPVDVVIAETRDRVLLLRPLTQEESAAAVAVAIQAAEKAAASAAFDLRSKELRDDLGAACRLGAPEPPSYPAVLGRERRDYNYAESPDGYRPAGTIRNAVCPVYDRTAVMAWATALNDWETRIAQHYAVADQEWRAAHAYALLEHEQAARTLGLPTYRAGVWAVTPLRPELPDSAIVR